MSGLTVIRPGRAGRSSNQLPLTLSLSKGACAVLPFLSLAACSQEKPLVPPVAEGSEHIACAVEGASRLSRTCAVERAEEGGKLVLVVRHPDGAFRRFSVLTDGRGIAVADGADEAESALDGDNLEVTVGEDRYVFPATVKRAAGGADAR